MTFPFSPHDILGLFLLKNNSPFIFLILIVLLPNGMFSSSLNIWDSISSNFKCKGVYPELGPYGIFVWQGIFIYCCISKYSNTIS